MIRMSTKIYNGFVLPKMTLIELNEFSKQFREKAKEAAIEQAETFLARRIERTIDRLCLLTEKEFIDKCIKKENQTDRAASELYSYYRPLLHQYYEAYERYQEVQRTNHRDPQVDLDANVVYIPLEDKTLAMFYGEQDAIKKLWEQEEQVAYYGYWNNTDPDEDCSDEEWEQRKNDWEVALPGYTLPLEAGIIAEFVKGFPNKSELSPKRIVSYMNSHEKRAKDLAKETLEHQKYKEYEENGETSGYTIVVKAREWLKTEEGAKAWKALTQEYQAKLLPVIEKEHLTTSYTKLKEMFDQKV